MARPTRRPTLERGPRRVRDERGVVFPSPVVMLSILAIAMAGIAYVATRSPEPTEREVATVARSVPSPSSTPTSADPTPTLRTHSGQLIKRKPPKPPKPVVDRATTYVEVYNNSGITGLAGQYAGTAASAGWQVVGSDNWYGTIPTSTVYYPARLQAAAQALALDLGIGRTSPAIDPMRGDRLTVVLTADAA